MGNQYYLVVFISIILLAIGIGVRLRFGGENKRLAGTGAPKPINGRLPYTNRPLLSDAEQSFYRALHLALDPDLVIFSKVRLANLVSVERGTPDAIAYQNKLNIKYVDIVLCDLRTLSPQLVIMLDYSTQASAAFEQIDSILRVAGLKVLHVPVKDIYSPSALGVEIKAALGPAALLEHSRAR